MMAKALSQLEVGELGILAFGQTARLLHPFDKPFTDQAGMEIISQFGFKQEGTDMAGLMEMAVQTLALSKYAATGKNMQLLFIVSDGRFGARAAEVKGWIRQASERGIFLVFLITDNPGTDSILGVETISWVGGKPKRTPYLDTFPFPNYIILHDSASLPPILADALRQWFELIQQKSS